MVHEIKLQWPDLFRKIELKEGMDNDLIVFPEIVPIIFVPGIMGTVLIDEGGVEVWNPDRDLKLFWDVGLWGAAPSKRRARLIGPGPHDERFLRVRGGNDIKSQDNGWEGVLESSYGDLHKYLKNNEWSDVIRMCFHMPVHAFGYNWSNDPGTSALALREYIDTVIRKYDNPADEIYCKQVILITHSMGGLVARAACTEPSTQSQVLGVIHGVQPATGTPSGYWRMKAGFERVFSPDKFKALKNVFTAWTLGGNGREVTALLANMPGGLALLPNKRYVDSHGDEQWLVLEHDGKVLDKLPRARHDGGAGPPRFDPYEDIYRQDAVAWGLVEPKLVHPDGDPATAWQWYLAALSRAEKFHDMLGEYQHPNSRHLFGRQVPTPTRVVLKLDCLEERVEHDGSADLSWTLHTIPPPESLTFDHPAFKHMTRTYGGAGFSALSGALRNPLNGAKYHVQMRLNSSQLTEDGRIADGGDGTVADSSTRALLDYDEPQHRREVARLEHEPAMAHIETEKFIKEAIVSFCHTKMYEELTAGVSR